MIRVKYHNPFYYPMTSMKPGGKFQIETQTNTATCLNPEGINCGVGTLKAKFHILIIEKNGNIVRGNSQGVIEGSGCNELLTGDDSSNKNITIDLDQLSFEYNTNKRLLSIAGNDNEWRFNAVGTVEDFTNNKTKFDINIELTAVNGDVITAEMTDVYIEEIPSG